MAVRTMLTAALFGLAAGPLALAEEPAPGPTGTVILAEQDEAMIVAIADAQASFETFWTAYLAASPGTGRFAVKVGLPTRAGGTEHIWVTDLARTGDALTGTLGNEPVDLRDYSAAGETVSFRLMDVTDWGYAEGNRLRGHFTTRARIPQMNAMEADEVRSLLHEDPLPKEDTQ